MFFAQFLIVLLPIMIPNILHMFVVRYDLLSSLRRPVNQKLFGANKTWRGFVVVPLLTIPVLAMSVYMDGLLPEGAQVGMGTQPLIPYAIVLGLIYCLGELPNSYLKRRMGIAPGQQASKHQGLFIALDHVDSSVPILAFFALTLDLEPFAYFQIWLSGVSLHFVINYLLYLAGVRKSPL